MLRVMTLNLNGYVEKHGEWTARRGLILSAIQSVQPDILALQAVAKDNRRFGGHDQATQLALQGASVAGGTPASAPVEDRPGEHEPKGGYSHIYFQPAAAAVDGIEAGTAIVSRLPFAATDYLRLSLLPDLEDTTRRVVLMARFDRPNGPFYLFNAHFSWVREQLENNLAEALPWLTAVEAPALLVGDLNAPAGEGLLTLLREAGWVDAWETLRGGEPGHTFEAGQPSIRIDYAWANPYLAGRLSAIDIVCTEEGPAGEHVSDHYGLLVSIDI